MHVQNTKEMLLESEASESNKHINKENTFLPSIYAFGLCGLRLLVLYSASRGFSPVPPVSPLLKNQHLI